MGKLVQTTAQSDRIVTHPKKYLDQEVQCDYPEAFHVTSARACEHKFRKEVSSSASPTTPKEIESNAQENFQIGPGKDLGRPNHPFSDANLTEEQIKANSELQLAYHTAGSPDSIVRTSFSPLLNYANKDGSSPFSQLHYPTSFPSAPLHLTPSFPLSSTFRYYHHRLA
jgi:hypothetical protein